MCASSPSRSRPGRVLTAVVFAGVALSAAVVPGAAQPASGFLALDGHAWRGLGEGEKLALLTGFLIGGAVEQATALASGPPPGSPAGSPPGSIDIAPETLDALRREGRLRFAFAPTVYKARIEDFYFYQDRRAVPLYRALQLIDAQIRRGAAGAP